MVNYCKELQLQYVHWTAQELCPRHPHECNCNIQRVRFFLQKQCYLMEWAELPDTTYGQKWYCFQKKRDNLIISSIPSNGESPTHEWPT